MGFLRKYFGDPLVGVMALVALGVIGGIILSAFRQASRERGFRRHLKNKHRHVD